MIKMTGFMFYFFKHGFHYQNYGRILNERSSEAMHDCRHGFQPLFSVSVFQNILILTGGIKMLIYLAVCDYFR